MKKLILKLDTLFKTENFLILSLIGLTTLIIGTIITKMLPNMPVVSDSVDYHSIAKTILENHRYFVIPDGLLIYPPLYPIFVAVIYSITHIGAYKAVYFAQYLLVGIISVILFFVLKKKFNVSTWTACFGAGLILVWPYFVLYSQLISSEIFYTVLLVGFFTILLTITKDAPWKKIIFAGILLGLVILTRPVALLLVPWIIIGGFILSVLFKVPENTLPYKKYLIVFLIALATLIPWETYVATMYHRIIPVASNLPGVFAKANKTLSYLSPTAEQEHVTAGKLVVAKLKNVYLFWNPGANGYHMDIVQGKYSMLAIAITLYKILFFAVLFLAFLAVLWFRMRTNVLLVVLVITYFWTLHTALFPFPRYMMPVIPFVIILAILSIQELVTRYGTLIKNSRFYTSKK